MTINPSPFAQMSTIIPTGTSGRYTIKHNTITPEKAEHLRAMGRIRGESSVMMMQPGTYCELSHQSESSSFSDVVMSDTPFERMTNEPFYHRATGHVLLGGLGIGMMAHALCRKPGIKSVTVVEVSPDVIALTAPHIHHDLLTVIQSDVFTYEPDRKHNAIWMDIWTFISQDNYAEHEALTRRYRPHLARGGFMDCWLSGEMRAFVR